MNRRTPPILAGILSYDPEQLDGTALSLDTFIRTGELFLPLAATYPVPATLGAVQRLRHFKDSKAAVARPVNGEAVRLNGQALAAEQEGPAVVVTTWSSLARDAAILFALGSKRRLIVGEVLNDVMMQSVRAGHTSITAFGDLGTFEEGLLKVIWGITGGSATRVGIVPARSRAEAEWWVLKRLFADILYQEYIGAAILARDTTADSFSDQQAVLRESDFTSVGAARLASPHQLCLAEFHAKECCARFNEHVFCGLPRLNSLALLDDDAAVPGCGNHKGCIWPLIPFNITQLNSAHVIVVSCGSLRLNNRLFQAQFGMGLNIFANTPRSYLSPIRFVVSNSFLSSILADLGAAGLELGEIAAEANEFLQLARSDDPCFVLLGDPCDRVDVLKAAATAESASSREVQPDAVPSAPLLAVSTTKSLEIEANVRCYTCSDEDPWAYTDVVNRIPRELRELASLGQPNGSSNAFLQAVVNADGAEGLWLTLRYGGGAEHRAIGPEVSCLWCKGACAVYSRRDASEGWSRAVINCPKCGIVADVPEGWYGRAAIEAPWMVSKGETLNLSSTCDLSTPEYGAACGFSLIHAKTFGWRSFERTRIDLQVEGHVATARMQIPVPLEAYPFAYWVRATWVTREGVLWLSKPLIVR